MDKKQKYKHSKIDLIWIIPEMLGGLGFIIATLVVLTRILDYLEVWELIFFIGLVVVVLDKGLHWFFKSIKDIIEVFTK